VFASDSGCIYRIEMRHIISLSTIPPRFADIGPPLRALLAQTSRPEAVELYIPRTYRRFPQWGGGLPEVPEGVKIVRIDEDLGPGTKILPAARAYRGQDIELLFVDDDSLYFPDWAARILKLRRKMPNTALCASGLTMDGMGLSWSAGKPLPRAVIAPRANRQLGFHFRHLLECAKRHSPDRPDLRAWFRKVDRSGYVDVAEGVAGVAIRPDYIDDLAFIVPPVLWAVDDVWISGHLARRGVRIWADKRLNCAQALVKLQLTYPLFKAVLDGANRKQANLACVDYMRKTYGIWGGEATHSV
jgi:hypothetical protein